MKEYTLKKERNKYYQNIFIAEEGWKNKQENRSQAREFTFYFLRVLNHVK